MTITKSCTKIYQIQVYNDFNGFLLRSGIYNKRADLILCEEVEKMMQIDFPIKNMIE